MSRRIPQGCSAFLGAETIERLEEKLSKAKHRTQTETSTPIEKVMAETEIKVTKDLLLQMGLMLTFGIKGKAEIHPSPNSKISHCD